MIELLGEGRRQAAGESAAADGFLLDGVRLTAAVGLLGVGGALSLWLAFAIPRRSH